MPNQSSIAIHHKYFKENNIIGSGLIFIGAICFSTKAIFVKLAYQFDIDAVSLLNLRMLFSLPFFVAVAIFIGHKSDKYIFSKNDFVKISVLGILGYYVASLLDFEGLNYITAGMERLILFVYPTIVVIISALVYRKAITKYQIIALFLTYTGIYVAFAFDLNFESQKD